MSISMVNVQTKLHFKGLKQAEVARQLGISGAWLSRICHGWAPMPLEKAIALAELLDEPVEDVARAFNQIWLANRRPNWGRRKPANGRGA